MNLNGTSLYSPVPGILSRSTFAVTTAASGYLYYRTLAPPNALPDYSHSGSSSKDKDTPIDTIATRQTWQLVFLFRISCLLLAWWQALLIAFPTYPVAPLPPEAHPLNLTLLTWNPVSAVVLLMHIIACLVRLHAFTHLGADFTFQLRTPSRLNTSGLYNWVQHPSYSGGLIAFATFISWFARCDGAIGTVLPTFILDMQHALWNWLLPGTCTIMAVTSIAVRVRDEETMLRKCFGEEWERWHERTARFIPWIF